MEAPEKGKSVVETSNPLMIEKLADLMPRILKGVFKKAFHNTNSRVASKYSMVEYLAQTSCAMLALELLHIFPTQRDSLLTGLGSMDSSSLMEKFNISDVNMLLLYHVAL